MSAVSCARANPPAAIDDEQPFGERKVTFELPKQMANLLLQRAPLHDAGLDRQGHFGCRLGHGTQRQDGEVRRRLEPLQVDRLAEPTRLDRQAVAEQVALELPERAMDIVTFPAIASAGADPAKGVVVARAALLRSGLKRRGSAERRERIADCHQDAPVWLNEASHVGQRRLVERAVVQDAEDEAAEHHVELPIGRAHAVQHFAMAKLDAGHRRL